MAKTLIIRLSSIGDVAMTIPVIYSVAKAYPNDMFTVLTQEFLLPIFTNRPPNVRMLGINTKGKERSLTGLLRFASSLSGHQFDKVIDLHNVIRTKIICSFFSIKKVPVTVIRRNRKEKKQLTGKHKLLRKLPLVTEQYAGAFKEAGFHFQNTFISLFDSLPELPAEILSQYGQKENKWIGIAPFARHKGKIYPPEKMEQVVAQLCKQQDLSIFLFGGRGEEAEILDRWAEQYPQVKSVAGRYSMDQELVLLSWLDILVSMDSANMHLASLVRTRVISIWGATHPYAGFYGYKQDWEDIIQLDLPCRPCSIYGRKPCFRGDWACMNRLETEVIIRKIKNTLT